MSHSSSIDFNRIPVLALILAGTSALAPLPGLAAPSDAAGADKTSPPALQARSAGERRSVDLTVYNSNLALIREERVLPLAKGANRVVIPDVPATIDPTSLHLAAVGAADAVQVLEQNYQYDLVNQGKLLEKYIGKTVEFLRPDPDGKREIPVSGRLLSVGPEAGMYRGGGDVPVNPGLIAEIGGKIEVSPVGRLSLPSLPEGLVLKPQLEWRITSSKAGDQKAEISYLAGSLSWSCDYVALLDKDDGKLDLTGWVTLVNHSGTAFRNAGLKLVAGDVNRVSEPEEFSDMSAKQMRMAAAAPPQFEQRELFEYKIYSLQRRTDLNNNESKQIELASAQGVPVRKGLNSPDGR